MSWVVRFAIYVPIVFLIMVVYTGQGQADAAGVVRIAARKTVKVVWWTIVLVLAMAVLEYLFLP